MPAGGRACWRLPLQGALTIASIGCPLQQAWPWVASLAWGLAVVGRLSSSLPSLEIVCPCIPNSDGEDEGGQASSSLAVSTRWISAVKLLKSDLATLAQREGGE
ncbi:hypothetical protein B296_00058923 [Ensete ventricosum]|uniref:Uncharacterized protein n=1 Tax=Ensete ventricosum TaxID=4639 RepID=A0A426WYU8_ENSVE|nr:hypothetical protein B296_00058923 [Ensete ventricosum]